MALAILAAGRRARRLGARSFRRALLEVFEPRVMLSGSFLPVDLTGSVALGGLNKAGVLAFDGVSSVTAGSWTNQDGSLDTQVLAGTGSAFTVVSTGVVGMTLETAPLGATAGSSVIAMGIMNATKDVVALNETAGGVPAYGGLDLLVAHTGAFVVGDFAGTWNIAAADFRGTVTINAAGHVTGGLIYLESNQKSAKITGGTATLNANGTGTLALNTAFAGANAAFATMALEVTMNTTKDVVVAGNASIGQPASSGTVPAELTVLVKTSGVYAKSDVVGVAWTMESALGTGTITFAAGGTVAGTLLGVDGVTSVLSGNYTLGGNGTIITNLTATHGGSATHFSLYGAVNRSKNLMALDRAIANRGTNSSLTVLISPANHAPTERALAVLPDAALHGSTLTIDYATIAAATSAADLDGDGLSYLITAAPAASGTLSITKGGATSVVIPGTTYLEQDDTLSWTPASAAGAQANAFSVEAWDGTALAARATKIVISTLPMAVVSAKAMKAHALEAQAGKAAGDGIIQIQRAGGDQNQALTVTLSVGGTAQQGVNYNLIGSDGVPVLSGAAPTVVFAAGQNTINLRVSPLEDHVVDGALSVVVMVAADPNAATPAYVPSVHPTAQVNALDSAPWVGITARVAAIKEGGADVRTFIVTRLAAQGGQLTGSLTVNLAYSGTFDTVHSLSAPASVTFATGEVKKVVTVTTADDHIADNTETLSATISGSGFATSGLGTATVNVLDASPAVSLVPGQAKALEAQPQAKPGKFTVRRTGSTALPLTVDFSTASGGIFGTLGTNYQLTDAGDNVLTNSVVIPAGKGNVAVTLTPIDDGANDPTLHATIMLQADGGPTYHLGAVSQVTVNIVNNDRRPTIANGTVSENTTVNAALSRTYSQLASLMGAALAPGETHGTLQLKVLAAPRGTLQIVPGGVGTPLSAPVGTIIDAGDVLVWSPPVGVQGKTLNAFSLTAVDGTLKAGINSRFSVAIT